ncbi:MAG TPA: sensory rhodopsin transducer [Stellaceae bacterium]|nr:sensory rhodopsin transducer [Stellaceae bacterium]
MMPAVGRKLWVIAEGYIPGSGAGPAPALSSHETVCMLNPGGTDAQIEITLYFEDREPVGPYRVTVPARRTRHLRFNDLADPAPVPRDTSYASLIVSNVPIVCQHTRLDSRQPPHALLSTIAWAGDE